MNDNYLWDGSGEPDAEVQHLEEILGSDRSAAKRLPNKIMRIGKLAVETGPLVVRL